MSRSALKSPWLWGGIVAVVAVASVGVWYAVAHAGDAGPQVPEGFRVEDIQATADDPAKAVAKANEFFRRTDLTEEQRHAVFDNMRQVMEEQLDGNIDEWMAATPDQKLAVLDRQIDQMQAFMKEMEKHRAEWEKRREEERKRREAERARNGNDNQAEEDRGPGGRWRERMATPQGRKQATESRDPDQMARRMGYFSAMMGRMKARGIDMPFGPGRGGPGGGNRPAGNTTPPPRRGPRSGE